MRYISFNKFNFKDKYLLITGIFLLLVSIVPRVIISLNRQIILDEAVVLSTIYRATTYKFDLFFSDIHTVLYNFLISGWLSVFGYKLIALKMFSVMVSTLSVWIIYYFGLRIFNKKVALLSALFLSLSPVYILYSQIGRSFSLVTLFCLLSSYFFLSLFKNSTFKNKLLYIFSSFFMVHSHLITLTVLFAQFVFLMYYFYRREDRTILIQVMKSYVIIMVSCFPLFITLLNRFNLVKDIPEIYSWVQMPDVNTVGDAVVFLSGGNIFLFCCLTVVFLVALTRLIKEKDIVLSKIEKLTLVYLVLWAIMPAVVLYFFSVLFHPVFLERGLVPSIPPVILLFSYSIFIFTKSKPLQFILVISVAMISIYQISVNYNEADEGTGWGMMNEYLKENIREQDRTAEIYITPKYVSLPFVYLYKQDCFFLREQDYESCLNMNNIFLLSKEDETQTGSQNKCKQWFLNYRPGSIEIRESGKAQIRFSGF